MKKSIMSTSTKKTTDKKVSVKIWDHDDIYSREPWEKFTCKKSELLKELKECVDGSEDDIQAFIDECSDCGEMNASAYGLGDYGIEIKTK
jgi:hypothetical protein